jgi:PAS domain S-box-containing protein
MEAALEKYTDLYDFAPVGYFSLDAQGQILEVNLMGAAMLGVERSQLIHRRIKRFVAPASQAILLDFLKQVFAGHGKQACEATLLKANGQAFWANLHATSAASPNGPRTWCRMAVSDITALKRAEEVQRRLEVLGVENRELALEIVRRQVVEEALKRSKQNQNQLLEESQRMQEQLRRLTHRILHAQEEERRRISRELHDEITQILVGINVHLESLTQQSMVDPLRLKQRSPERNGWWKSRWLPKCPTGIQGLDEITGGGLPRGRPTLVCGGAGCGKTLFAAEFLVRGAAQFGEPGVFMSFEETDAELKANVASLGFDLAGLVRRKKIVLEHVTSSAVKSMRPANMTWKACSSGSITRLIPSAPNAWCWTRSKRCSPACPTKPSCAPSCAGSSAGSRTKGVTAVITAERGREQLTRHGLEEYVSDCVILLDHRVQDQIATRHLRVVKYRGALHGTNEFPFLIGDEGFSVLPITSLGLNHKVSNERISTGIPRLDAMLGGRGFFAAAAFCSRARPAPARPSSPPVLPRRPPGAGSACSFLVRGIAQPDHPQHAFHRVATWSRWSKRGLLRFHAARPTLYGLEMHLATMFKEIAAFQPQVVIVDPITSLLAAGTDSETKGW